jgi:hypothetical protein
MIRWGTQLHSVGVPSGGLEPKVECAIRLVDVVGLR